jgi:hypothetical protein
MTIRSMKKISCTIFFILALMAYACRQASDKQAGAGQSGIKFSQTSFDYGRIPQGAPGECTFEFTNISDIPLVINNVKTSCGCTSPKWTKDPIPPDQKGVIRIRYNTNIRGTFKKTITVFSNASNSPVNLFITGEVYSEKTHN